MPCRLTDKSEIRRLLNTDQEMVTLCACRPGRPHVRTLRLVGAWKRIGAGIPCAGNSAHFRFGRCPLRAGTAGSSLRSRRDISTSSLSNWMPRSGIYEFRHRHHMRRMFLDNLKLCFGTTEPLTTRDCVEVQRLYATGDGGGIGFAPSNSALGFFRGIRRDGELVAVAGVHVVSSAGERCRVGNIFTRPISVVMAWHRRSRPP